MTNVIPRLTMTLNHLFVFSLGLHSINLVLEGIVPTEKQQEQKQSIILTKYAVHPILINTLKFVRIS